MQVQGAASGFPSVRAQMFYCMFGLAKHKPEVKAGPAGGRSTV